MSIEKTRDIVLIVCAVLFVLTYSFSTLSPFILPLLMFQQEATDFASFSFTSSPSISADCRTGLNNVTTLTIIVSNQGEGDIKNIKCRLLDKAGLTSSEDSKSIPETLGPQSVDICTFELTGDYQDVYQKTLKFEVSYNEKSVHQVAQCYYSGY